jgi:hypothetical protein
LIMLIFRRSHSRVLGARPRRACLDGAAVDRRWYATARPSWIAHFPVFSCRAAKPMTPGFDIQGAHHHSDRPAGDRWPDLR